MGGKDFYQVLGVRCVGRMHMWREEEGREGEDDHPRSWFRAPSAAK